MTWSRSDMFVEYVIEYIAKEKLKENAVTREFGDIFKDVAEMVAFRFDEGKYCKLCGAGPYRSASQIMMHFRKNHRYCIKAIFRDLKNARKAKKAG